MHHSTMGTILKDVFAEHFLGIVNEIGGPGTIIEIDETSISKRKYNIGHLPGYHRQWMFGGIERGTKRCFLKLVDQCNATTLLPIIQENILPGTTITSDLWAAYGGVVMLPQNYQHLIVNHT